MISRTGLIQLSNGPATAVVNPRGAVLQRWNYGGRDLLFFRTDMPGRSSHPCLPNFGPLYDPATREKLVQCTVGGKTLKLPQHGFGKTLDWEVNPSPLFPNTADLSLANPFDGSRSDIMDMYPYPFQSNLTIGLTEKNSLLYKLMFLNMGQEPAPVDLACHAYFPWIPGVTVHGLDGLPFDDTTADWKNLVKGRVSGPADFLEQKNRDWEIYLFDGSALRDTFEIRYPATQDAAGYSLFMKILNQSAQEIEVWTKPEIGPFICVEPVARGRGALQSIQGRTPIMPAPGRFALLAFELTIQEN